MMKMVRFGLLSVWLGISVSAFAQKDVLVVQSYISNISNSWVTVLNEEAVNYDFKPFSVLDTLSSLLNYKAILFTDDGVDETGHLTAQRKQNLLSAIRNNRSVYIQSEYSNTYETNIFFDELTDSLGGVFEWTNVQSGSFSPLVLPPFDSSPYVVSQVFGFWYGITGTYDNTIVKPFITTDGIGLAFYVTPANPSYGKVVTMTDRDFFMGGSSAAKMLLKNIVSYLVGNSSLPVELSSFTAQSNNGKIQLKWSTASESNNAGWEVESRIQKSVVSSQKSGSSVTQSGVANPSADVIEAWTKITFIPGKGTTTEKQNYEFKVSSSEFNTTGLQFRLKQIDLDGKFTYSNILSVDVTPNGFELMQNYPNPFNPVTVISYKLQVQSDVKLVVFDLLGREVATLVNTKKEAGQYTETFNAAGLSSGIYYYTLTANGQSMTKSMSIIK